VAQQQCAGPLQLPVADVAVTADSYLATTGRCWAIGDQPVKWIVSPESSVRLAACEALTNLVWALVDDFEGILRYTPIPRWMHGSVAYEILSANDLRGNPLYSGASGSFKVNIDTLPPFASIVERAFKVKVAVNVMK
jgi:hypothetical protein